MKKKPNRILISSLLMTVLCVAALALIAPLPGGGWWFGAQVQNVSSNTASVTFTTYDFASDTYSTISNISPGASGNYGMNTFSLPGNFQGSSKANSNQDIRAIVNLTNRYAGGYGDSASLSPAAGQYDGLVAAATTLRFPLVKNEQGEPNPLTPAQEKTTTIIIQNVGTAQTTITADFIFQPPPLYNHWC